MILNQGKRNKQAVQVLNKIEYDSEGNPIGMMEDPSNPASANFGTPREPRRGGCYKGDGSAYITITGLLSTDTVEVFDGSDMPTISNGRLDIASEDRVFGVKIFRAGELWAKYNCSENSGNIAYDSSGNGNHGTVVNAITTTPEENPNSIHQYQDIYSFENEEGYSESGSVLIPKNSSITLPPFKDVLGNNLQYVGKVPGKAKFVNSSCFLSDGNAYLSVDVLTTDTITAHPESEVPVCTTDGRLDFPIVGGKYFDITIEKGGSVVARLPLCEPIIDPSNHIYHDVSGNGNHATLINGTLANEGKQDTFHYLQRGHGRSASVNKFTSWRSFVNVEKTSIPDISPIGTSVDFLKETVTETELHHYTTFETASPKPYDIITHSVYAKYAGRRYLTIGSWGWSVEMFCIVDLLEGKITHEKYNRCSKISINITDVGDGWYRVLQESKNLATQATPQSYHVGMTVNPKPTIDYNYRGDPYIGDGTSGILIWNLKIGDKRSIIKPLVVDSNWDAGGDYVYNIQDGHTFLNTGTELEAYDYPALKQADKDDNFWYIGDAGVRRVSHYELAIENLMSDKIFLDKTDKNI